MTPTDAAGAYFQVPEPRRGDLAAPLEGRKVALRPLTPSDYDFVYRMATSPAALLRWRHRGSPPPPEQFGQLLWQGVLTQFVVVSKSEGTPMGLVSAYSADFRNQCVSFAMLVTPEYERAGTALEGGFVFIDYLFKVWSFRKVYIESLEFNVRTFWSGLGDLFEVEGCLRNHEYHDGRYWHVYYLAIYRESWLRATERLQPASSLNCHVTDVTS